MNFEHMQAISSHFRQITFLIKLAGQQSDDVPHPHLKSVLASLSNESLHLPTDSILTLSNNSGRFIHISKRLKT